MLVVLFQKGKGGKSVVMNVRVLVMLWECPVNRNDFMCKLQELLGDGYEHLESQDCYGIGLSSGLWIIFLLDLVMIFVSKGRLGSVTKTPVFHSHSDIIYGTGGFWGW